MQYLTSSAKQTRALGRKLAKKILKNSKKNRDSKDSDKYRNNAVVIALEGDLGGGKTTFLQGFAEGLGIKEKILSPTFVIVKNYKLQTTNYQLFYHIDCYRIEKPQEILAIGFREIISDPKNIVAVEWADRVKKILPSNCLVVKFDFINQTKRRITVKNF